MSYMINKGYITLSRAGIVNYITRCTIQDKTGNLIALTMTHSTKDMTHY